MQSSLQHNNVTESKTSASLVVSAISPQKQAELAEMIVKDVLIKLKEAENQEGARETTVTSEAKIYWKAILVSSNDATDSSNINLSNKDFKQVWDMVKADVIKRLESPWKSLWMPNYDVLSPDPFEWYRA